MRKYLLALFFTVFIIMGIANISEAVCPTNLTCNKSFCVYPANVKTGGGTGALDSIDGDCLFDGYMALVVTQDSDATNPKNGEFYTVDADCTTPVNQCTTDDDLIIAPTSNPANKRWIKTQLKNLVIQGDLTVSGTITQSLTDIQAMNIDGAWTTNADQLAHFQSTYSGAGGGSGDTIFSIARYEAGTWTGNNAPVGTYNQLVPTANITVDEIYGMTSIGARLSSNTASTTTADKIYSLRALPLQIDGLTAGTVDLTDVGAVWIKDIAESGGDADDLNTLTNFYGIKVDTFTNAVAAAGTALATEVYTLASNNINDASRICMGTSLEACMSFDATDFLINQSLNTSNAAGGALLNETSSDTNPTLVPNKADPDTGIGSGSADKLNLIAGGVDAISMSSTVITPQISFAQSNNTITCSGDACVNTTLLDVNVTAIQTDGAGGADALTLQDGSTGMEKTIYIRVHGGSDLTITPTTFINGTSITIDAVGKPLTFYWDAFGWMIKENPAQIAVTP